MSIFSAIGSLVGGVLGNQSAKKREQQAQRWQENVMKKQIQWKVSDAKAAGIHPIAALGHSMVSPSPTMIGRESYSDMGQNVGRAIDATMSAPQKVDDYTRALQRLQLERGELENSILRTQLVSSAARTVNQAGNPPLFRSDDAVMAREAQRRRVGGVLDLQDFQGYLGPNYKFVPGPTGQQIEDQFGDAGILDQIDRRLRDYIVNWDSYYPGQKAWPGQKRARDWATRHLYTRRHSKVDHSYW